MQVEYLAFAVLAIGLVLLLIRAIWKFRIKKHQQTAQFQALCRSTGLKMDLFEFFSNRVIGIDYQQAAVLYMQFIGDHYKHQIILIEELDQCSLEKQFNENNIIEGIYLLCRLKDKSLCRIGFYSAKTDHHLDATQLVRKAAYWKRKINMLKQFEELSLEQYQ
ncbi:MAG: hypothetical protein JNK20_07860 [Flavipsychrobacter sp.]|jgi:hypothetical protein|nr:hypothetical protein [Flavipsychrobacter sp.]